MKTYNYHVILCFDDCIYPHNTLFNRDIEKLGEAMKGSQGNGDSRTPRKTGKQT
jgi:hypothetical protein